MIDAILKWFQDAENVRVIISNFVLPITVGILAFIASNSISTWRTRKKQSLLGTAICASLIEEIKNGINIMKAVQTAMNGQSQIAGSLPRKSWNGMNTISDDILERLLCISEKKDNRGFPIKEIRIHLKNYFDHMCPNFDNIINAINSGGNWQQQAQIYLVQGKYIEAAEKVLFMLEDAQSFLDNNRKSKFPK